MCNFELYDTRQATCKCVPLIEVVAGPRALAVRQQCYSGTFEALAEHTTTCITTNPFLTF